MISQNKVAIISNDAGGAELVSSWLLHNKRPHKLSLNGPAKGIFERKIGKYENIRLKSAIDQSDWVLTGTGWSTNLEVAAIKYALSESKHVVSIIDHWVNYKERFFHEGKTYLPNEIWVTDKIALEHAQSLFKNVKVKLITNHYLEDLLIEIDDFQKIFTPGDEASILYICEPMRTDWGKNSEDGEFQALNFFLNNLDMIEASKEPNITLRLHPSENEAKYDKFLNENSYSLKVQSNKEISLSKQIAESDIIVGCQSYALAIAVAAKKKVISVMPPWAPECIIPLEDIEHLRELV